MARYLIYISSITYAIKARDILRKNNIKAYVERTADVEERQGCGYGVAVDGDLNRVRSILMAARINFSEQKRGGFER